MHPTTSENGVGGRITFAVRPDSGDQVTVILKNDIILAIYEHHQSLTKNIYLDTLTSLQARHTHGSLFSLSSSGGDR